MPRRSAAVSSYDGDLNQKLRCGSRADRNRRSIGAAHLHRVGGGIAALDRDGLPRLQMIVFDEAEKRWILIGNSRYAQRHPNRTAQEAFEMIRADRAFRRGNRIAMWIMRGTSEH